MDPRDREVARETVRPPSDCPHCNPTDPVQAEALARTLAGLDLTLDEVRCRDRVPVDVAALPPWPCCGARGPHADGCPVLIYGRAAVLDTWPGDGYVDPDC